MMELVIEEMKHQIIAAIRAGAQGETLWGADEIAHFLRMTPNGVRSHIVNTPGFPKPVILPSGGKRYLPDEVRSWAKTRR